MTLNDLLENLEAAPPASALIFRTEHGDIGRGYHVTEFKHARITGIDCGARMSEWGEASIQLLDGDGDAHMQVSKFSGILRQSLRQVEGLGEAPTHVEFAPGNNGLRTYDIDAPDISAEAVIVNLREKSAICKPSRMFVGLQTAEGEQAPQRRCCT